MTFFNKKEEVINIELTPYGKHLLSKGKWKPAYYEFYDDDVVYDSQYIGYQERQEEIQQRISETPRTKVLYSFNGAETRYKEYAKQFLESRSNLQNLLDSSLEKRKNFSFSSLPLANSSVREDKNPAWSIDVFKGKIEAVTSSVDVLGLPNNLYNLRLQTISYLLSVQKREERRNNIVLSDNAQIGGSSDLNLVHKTFEDNTYIKIDEDYLLLDIQEKNVDILKENFEMFIYEIEIDPKTGKEIEKPLHFKKPQEQVINNILVSNEQQEVEGYLGPQYASHYFNIYVDKEINTDLLSNYLTETEKKSLSITDGYVFRDKETTEQLLVSVPQIDSITTEEIDDFEGCE